MAKELIASKIIMSLDVDNEFASGVILYKIKEDGILGKDQKSIGITNMPFSKLHLTGIIDIIIEKVKEQEGINGD